MWEIQTTANPTPGGKGAIAIIEANQEKGAIALISRSPVENIAPGVPVQEVDGFVYTISPSFADVNGFSLNGVGYRPAAHPPQLLPGEYLINPYKGELKFKTVKPLDGGVAVRGQAGIKSTCHHGAIPEAIASLAIEGEINLSLRLGDHPQGDMTLAVNNVAEIQSYLSSGKTIELFGIGFSLSSPSLEEMDWNESPTGAALLKANLRGYWEWHSTQEPFVLGIPQFRGINQSEGQYTIAMQQAAALREAQAENTRKERFKTSLSALIEQIGGVFEGQDYTLYPSAETEARDTLQWVSLLEGRADALGCFVDWSMPSAIAYKRWDDVPTWEFVFRGTIKSNYENPILAPTRFNQVIGQPPAIGVTAQSYVQPVAPDIREEDLSNFAVPFRYEFPEVTSKFYETQAELEKERQKGSQYWYNRVYFTYDPPESNVVVVDPDNARSSPGNPKTLTTNADITGFTKTRKTIYLLNGSPLYEDIEVWGYAFTQRQLETGGASWTQIESTRTTYQFDARTGYELGHTVSGWKKVRVKPENPSEPETAGATDQALLDLHGFKTVPIRGGRCVVLGQIRDYFPSYQVEEPYELVDYTITPSDAPLWGLPAGTVIKQVRTDPNWIEPMFVLQDYSWETATNETTDPGSNIKIISGKESLSSEELVITGFGYFRARKNYSASDGNFSAGIQEQRNIQSAGGIPSEAPRRATTAERDLATPPPDEGQKKKAVRRYFLKSGGYSGPPRGSISFEFAESKDEVIASARSQLIAKLLAEGRQEVVGPIPFNPQIRPGDRVYYTHNGVVKRRRAYEVNHKIKVVPTLGGSAIEAETTLTLGEMRDGDSKVGIDDILGLELVQYKGFDQSFVIDLPPYYVGRKLSGTCPPVQFARIE